MERITFKWLLPIFEPCTPTFGVFLQLLTHNLTKASKVIRIYFAVHAFTYLGRPLPGTFVLNGILPLITKGGGLSWSNAIAHPAVVKRYNDSLWEWLIPSFLVEGLRASSPTPIFFSIIPIIARTNRPMEKEQCSNVFHTYLAGPLPGVFGLYWNSAADHLGQGAIVEQCHCTPGSCEAVRLGLWSTRQHNLW